MRNPMNMIPKPIRMFQDPRLGIGYEAPALR